MSDEAHAASQVETALEVRPEATVNAQGLFRLVLVLLAVWTVFSGLALVFFQSGSGATIGGGLGGGQGQAAQRLLGVHLLVLAPIYLLLAWEPLRYRMLLWVPFAAQGGVVLVTLYDIAADKRDFTDGALPLIVASIFLVLLVYIWRASRRPPLSAIESHALLVEPSASADSEPEKAT